MKRHKNKIKKIIVVLSVLLVFVVGSYFISTATTPKEDYQTELNTIDEELQKEQDEKKKQELLKQKQALEKKQKEDAEKKKKSEAKKKQQKKRTQNTSVPNQATPKSSSSKPSSKNKTPTKKPSTPKTPSQSKPAGIGCSTAYSKQKQLLQQGKASSVVELGGGQCNLITY